MNIRNLKIYRSVKYINKNLDFSSRNPFIRIGDSVCVIRGSNKGFKSLVKSIKGKYATLENLFVTGIASKKYFERNGNKNIDTRKYIKIAVDNLRHVDYENNIIKVQKKNSIVLQNIVFKKCLTDKNNKLVDNFVFKSIERKKIKKAEIEKQKQQKNSEKDNSYIAEHSETVKDQNHENK